MYAWLHNFQKGLNNFFLILDEKFLNSKSHFELCYTPFEVLFKKNADFGFEGKQWISFLKLHFFRTIEFYYSSIDKGLQEVHVFEKVRITQVQRLDCYQKKQAHNTTGAKIIGVSRLQLGACTLTLFKRFQIKIKASYEFVTKVENVLNCIQ